MAVPAVLLLPSLVASPVKVPLPGPGAVTGAAAQFCATSPRTRQGPEAHQSGPELGSDEAQQLRHPAQRGSPRTAPRFHCHCGRASVAATVAFRLELVVIPVADVDRAKPSTHDVQTATVADKSRHTVLSARVRAHVQRACVQARSHWARELRLGVGR